MHKGKTELEWANNLIYKHLQPKQELFLLRGEDLYREVAERKKIPCILSFPLEQGENFECVL